MIDLRTRTVERRWLPTAVAAVCLLVAAACGGDDDAPSSAPGDGSTVAADQDAAVVEPRIWCREADPITFLTYTNTGSETVEIQVGPANELVGPGGDVVAGVDRPTVFAPGDHDRVAFWVETGSTWTVGAGDAARSVETGDDVGPECPAEGGPDPDDTRTSELAHSVDLTRGDDGKIAAATIAMSYDGLDESRCPVGPVEWTPQPVEITFHRWVFDSFTETSELIARRAPLTVDVFDPHNAPAGGRDGHKAFRSVDLLVDATDVCIDGDGNRYTAWIATADVLSDGFLSEEVCFGLIEAADADEYGVVECGALPQTDGIRIRLP